MDENLHLTYHYELPAAGRKVKKGKKKKPLQHTMKESSSNQQLVDRLRALNQEKFLLLKQLHLQRQIDDNTTNLTSH
jgi:hypothetical protein